ncbi:hypothetical protein ACLI08_11485 [Flavobacterium sp. RNTU_13]|uniref:hypothetical protein n=1 Tax=Flavobacterium sp. RNTU_13 TaxID=3375145 RepID=UPI0039858682
MKKGIPTGKTGMPMRRYSGQLTTLFYVTTNVHNQHRWGNSKSDRKIEMIK